MLRANLECSYGLVDLLVRKGALSVEQGADIERPEHNSYEQNDKLLDLLLSNVHVRQHQVFIDALMKTKQEHLAVLLTGDEDVGSSGDQTPITEESGEKKPITEESGEKRPITEEECQLLERKIPNANAFRNKLSSLLDKLSSRGCISGEHVNAVKQRGVTERQQRARLLDIITRRSLKQYKLFLGVMRDQALLLDGECTKIGGYR